jgi:cleavage and polyadenylation specificity factor subunit 5
LLLCIHSFSSSSHSQNSQLEWRIADLLCTWYRPNFETHVYPYKVAHLTAMKETKKIFLAHLPQHCSFAVPRTMKLLAVPVFELYDNVARYAEDGEFCLFASFRFVFPFLTCLGLEI